MTTIERWRNWWSQEHTSVNTVAFLIAAASILSRFLGVFRDRLLASQYGAGWELDAYYAAFRLPDTLYNLLIVGALSAGFIPLFSRLKAQEGEESALKFSTSVFGWAAAGLGSLAIVGIVFAPQIMPLLVHGFDAQRLELTIDLTRILFLSPFFLGISAVFGSVLQASKRIMAFAFAPIWYNIGILFGILVLSRWFGIAGVAMGVIIGAFFHALTQGIVAFGLGVTWPQSLSYSKDLKQLLTITIPRLASLGASQLSLVILLSFASTLRAGSVSVFQLGNNLQSFPLGVIGISFAVAAFPLLSEAAGTKSFGDYHRVLEKTGRKIVFFLLPVSLTFVLLQTQLVRLILGDGLFDWRATIDTADVLACFAISLVAQALIPLLVRGFYAIQSTWTPFWITLAGETLNICLALLLKDRLGIMGLAIAFSVTAFFQAIALWFCLRRRVGAESQARFLQMIWWAGLACVPALLVGYGTRQLVGTIFPLRTFVQVAIQFTLTAGVTGGIYFVAMWALKVEEAKALVTKGGAVYAQLRRRLS